MISGRRCGLYGESPRLAWAADMRKLVTPRPLAGRWLVRLAANRGRPGYRPDAHKRVGFLHFQPRRSEITIMTITSCEDRGLKLIIIVTSSCD